MVGDQVTALVLDRSDAAYLGGLLDGEGCFDAPRGNPRVRVAMTDLDVVLRAADLMGAKTHIGVDKRDGHADTLVAQITGDRAIEVMRAVLPWMGSRRSAKIAEITLAHAAKKRGKIRLARVAS